MFGELRGKRESGKRESEVNSFIVSSQQVFRATHRLPKGNLLGLIWDKKPGEGKPCWWCCCRDSAPTHTRDMLST
jgi:hypothetical protein